MNEIEKLREEIDKVDREIVHLLNRRIELVLAIGDYKKSGKLPVEDLDREKKVVSSLSGDELDEDFIKEIYTVIFNYSKSKQL